LLVADGSVYVVDTDHKDVLLSNQPIMPYSDVSMMMIVGQVWSGCSKYRVVAYFEESSTESVTRESA
jgi:hypothetical protein